MVLQALHLDYAALQLDATARVLEKEDTGQPVRHKPGEERELE